MVIGQLALHLVQGKLGNGLLPAFESNNFTYKKSFIIFVKLFTYSDCVKQLEHKFNVQTVIFSVTTIVIMNQVCSVYAY